MARRADVLGYFPPVLQEIYEIQGVAQGQNSELNHLWQGAEDLLNDQFVETATQNGVSRWERMLGLNPKNTDTLPERKFRIQSALSGRLPFTVWGLRQQLSGLCGEENFQLTVDYANYKVSVLLALEAESNFEAVEEMLKTMLPANLIIEVSLLYRPYSELMPRRHANLASYTHQYIRKGGELS